MNQIEAVIEKTLSKEDTLKNSKEMIVGHCGLYRQKTAKEMLGTIKNVTGQVDKLNEENIDLYKKMKTRITNIEQYSRRNNVIRLVTFCKK